MIQQYEQGLKTTPHDWQPSDVVHDYQPIRVTGHYDNAHSFLLDNQFYQHQLGYHVITPFRIGHLVLMVNRGWVPANVNRAIRPLIEKVSSEQSLKGLVYQTNSSNLTLSSVEENPDQWPRLIESLNTQVMSTALKSPVMAFTLRLSPDEPYGYERDWSMPWMSPARHFAYAIQWFIFAGLSIVLGFGLSYRREEN